MSKIKIAIALFVLFLLLAIFLPGYSKLQGLKNKNENLTERIEELRIKNTQLAEEVEKLKNDPLYVEGIARKEMGLSKKGELVYKLVPAEAGKAGE